MTVMAGLSGSAFVLNQFLVPMNAKYHLRDAVDTTGDEIKK
jgi:hypothetical protein